MRVFSGENQPVFEVDFVILKITDSLDIKSSEWPPIGKCDHTQMASKRRKVALLRRQNLADSGRSALEPV